MDEKHSFNEDETPPTDILEMELLFPENYQVESYLGGGAFGQVMRCLKKDTNEIVAVKVPGYDVNVSDEFNVLRYLKSNHLDEYNIVRFIEAFLMEDKRIALVFENLDMTLHDYIFSKGDFIGLYLHEVRSVIQQMATALNALKSKGVIHSDIKSDNILLVDGQAQPIRVKLIDFGLAIPSAKARIGNTYQVAEYRAPEMYLGLPFTEAVDMWALGIIMAMMVLGIELISGNTKYNKMQRLVGLFGVPPDRLLNMGLYTQNYFTKTPSGHWRLKTPSEYWGPQVTKDEKARFRFQSLDELETLSVVSLDMVKADERKECIDLMKAMLQIDPYERITPYEVLNHPLITRGTVQHSSDNEKPGTSKTKEPETNKTEEPGTTKPEEPVNDEAEEMGTNEPEEPGADETTEWQTTQTDQPEDSNNDVCSNGSGGFQGSISSSSSRRVIFVQSAPPDLCQEDEDNEQQTCSNDSRGFQGSISSSSSRSVVLVQPAPPDFCQEDEDNEQQSESCSNGSSGSYEPIPASSSPRVIFVQSAPPDCCWDLVDLQSESCSNGSSGFHESIPASSSPRVIFVQSAPPDCCWDLVEDNDLQSESCSTIKLRDTSEDNSDSPHRVFLDHTDPEKKRKEKKKKNCFKRFFSWMRKTFCSCVAGNKDQD